MVLHVLERIESLEQSMAALESGVTSAVAALAREVGERMGSVRKETGSLAKALRLMAEHEQRVLADHETRLQRLEAAERDSG